jgi:hypothetical protein
VSAVALKNHITRAGRILLLLSASAVVPLVQPNPAVAQSFESCVASGVPAQNALDALRAFLQTLAFTGDDSDFADVEDVQEDVTDAIAGLAANVESDGGAPSRLAALCALLETDDFGEIDEANCTQEADGVACSAEPFFEDYQDAVEALGEGAIANITSPVIRESIKSSLADVYDAVAMFVQVAISRAEAEGGVIASSGSNSGSIADAIQDQAAAEAQAENCLAGTGEARACGDAVASFFDAWPNAIIEIIE